jgi:hypothetical protein
MDAGAPSSQSTPTLPRWPKSCRCGEVWSRTEWPELPPIGRYLAGTDGWIELRTCVCGSNLGVNVADLDVLPTRASGSPATAATGPAGHTPKGVRV